MPKDAPAEMRNTQGCIPSSSVVCTPAKEPGGPKLDFDDRAGGFLGLKKTLTSGREIIWPTVIELAGRSPVWGHGLGTSALADVPWPFTRMNAHSGFLQVYYQLGLVGVVLYFILWALLFIRAIAVPDVCARSASVAVLCAACVLDTLEIVLIQNHSGFGLALGILATTNFTNARREVMRRARHSLSTGEVCS
jgi:O-antigen ligase